MSVDEDAQELYSGMVTLLLSWQLARYFGRSEVAAIKKTARKLLTELKDEQSYDVIKKIAYSKSDFKVIETVKRCYEENKRLGYI